MRVVLDMIIHEWISENRHLNLAFASVVQVLSYVLLSVSESNQDVSPVLLVSERQ